MRSYFIECVIKFQTFVQAIVIDVKLRFRGTCLEQLEIN